ncbi:MAG: class I SAM-dependent methyltransferase [Anaerolineales bacterium]
MALIIDPEGKEIETLQRVADWRGARVLEVGCGDGRLTLRLARLGAQMVAFDPDRALIRQARRTLPKRLAARITYSVGSAQKVKHPAAAFDRVVFAWSL